MNVTRKSDSYYAALYHRIAARRGKKQAQVAVAHSLLVAIYPHILKDGTWHHDLGADYFEKRDRDELVRRAVGRLQHLGYRVSLEEVA